MKSQNRNRLTCISSTTAFLRQEYWRGLPFPSPGDLPSPVIKSSFPTLQADSLLSEQLREAKNNMNELMYETE